MCVHGVKEEVVALSARLEYNKFLHNYNNQSYLVAAAVNQSVDFQALATMLRTSKTSP